MISTFDQSTIRSLALNARENPNNPIRNTNLKHLVLGEPFWDEVYEEFTNLRTCKFCHLVGSCAPGRELVQDIRGSRHPYYRCSKSC